jgi:hypothetical protein
MCRGLIRGINFIFICMKTELLKNEIHHFIDRVDDKNLLLQIRSMLEKQVSAADTSLCITDEDIEIIDERKRRIATGQEELIPASEVINFLKNKHR